MNQPLLHCLIEALKSQGIAFCHWKSNALLADALASDGDLDLLVDRAQAQQFEQTLAELGFKRAIEPLQAVSPSILHFYGMDQQTGALLHVHAYYRVITGESLLKNYCLPVEELLLRDTRPMGEIPIPQAPAELMLFVIRAMAKHASLLEYMLLRRAGGAGYAALRAELAALLEGDTQARSAELLACWLPPVDRALFAACIEALRRDAPFLARFRLARRLRRQLKPYARLAPGAAAAQRAGLFLRRVARRLRGAGKSKQLASGGALIAFVGPEATGKSTLVHETASWLGGVFEVATVHLGKPPSTWLTYLPNLALPLLRQAAPQQRMSRVAGQAEETGKVSLLYAVRSVLLAWDRRVLATRVRRRAAAGGLVICDRYPSPIVGAMDSARLKPADQPGRKNRLMGLLAALENRIYRQMPPPDLVIRLTVPLEVALQRNKDRIKKGKEADAYVVRRHTMAVVPNFPTAKTIDVDSNQTRSQTIQDVRQIVWEYL